ncbi:MAG: hypothetical protein KU29_11410 [Sulfurovum sp. FS06-10]|nr:MAG: hypothetical protein KU29_11410 [Sulfurovum sp. FS06-10]
MSFTGFLFIILILILGFFGLQKILKSKTIRIALISYREHLQQKKIEEEIQKSRQRTLDEIKNPDRVMEIILKIKREEEVKIPLAAFDFIYRNMKKFSIVDKSGRITIINQEDYFKFKKEAMALMEKEKEDVIDARKILEQISQKVAENPIEITKHEDGTVVKIDHVSRTAEIMKPNGERIFIDHKTETMVSQNLIEKTEQKLPYKDHEKEAQIKHAKEENLLLKGKLKRLEQRESDNIEPSGLLAKEEILESPSIQEEAEDTNVLLLQSEKMQCAQDHSCVKNTKQVDIQPIATQSKSDFPIKKKASFDVNMKTPAEIETTTQTNDSNHSNNTKELFAFTSLPAFLANAITFKSLHDVLKEMVIQNLESSNFSVLFNALRTRIYDCLNADSTLSNMSEKLEAVNSVENNANLTYNDKGVAINAYMRYLGVVFDEKTSCVLINIHWFFLTLATYVKEENIIDFFNAFYVDSKKLFVDNQSLSTILAHFNEKSSFALGSKIFMQEQNENKPTNFKTIKFEFKENFYQGQYIFMFASNSFCKGLVQELEALIDSIQKPQIVDLESTVKPIKITIKTFL